MSNYLKKLNIDQAKKVQFIADGAKWIWKKAKSMFLKLGVDKDKIYETLDYYHGVEHLNSMVSSMPKKTYKNEKAKLLKYLKNLLRDGVEI